jgi:hypothetical protein
MRTWPYPAARLLHLRVEPDGGDELVGARAAACAGRQRARLGARLLGVGGHGRQFGEPRAHQLRAEAGDALEQRARRRVGDLQGVEALGKLGELGRQVLEVRHERLHGGRRGAVRVGHPDGAGRRFPELARLGRAEVSRLAACNTRVTSDARARARAAGAGQRANTARALGLPRLAKQAAYSGKSVSRTPTSFTSWPLRSCVISVRSRLISRPRPAGRRDAVRGESLAFPAQQAGDGGAVRAVRLRPRMFVFRNARVCSGFSTRITGALPWVAPHCCSHACSVSQ